MIFFSIVIWFGILWLVWKICSSGLSWITDNPLVQRLLVQIPGYWNIRRWMLKPLLGFRRLQLLLFALICTALGAHLVWFSGVLDFQPRVRSIAVNSALNTNWPTLTPLARIENSDRHDPSTSAVVKFPYPTIRMRVEDPDYRVGFVSIVKRVSEPKKLAIKDQERSLTCDVTDTTRKPSCRYEASIPIIHVFGLSINQSTASHQSTEEIRGLNVNLKSEGSKLRAYWRTGQFPHAEMNALQLRLPLHDQALKSKEWAVSQTNAWIRVAQGDTPFVLQVEANPKKLKEREEERCAAEKETGSEENRTPKCRSLSEGNFEYETGLCPRNKTVDAWACPWRVASPDARFVPSFALENSTVKHRASYELGTKDDRILLAMFLRVSGIIDEPFELTPGLTELRDQIIQDYKTVLGIDGVRSEDKNEITQALTRQPQLYPFYEDRDFWATPVMADLAGKLTELGLR